MLNIQLAQQRGLSDDDIKDLAALHNAMQVLDYYYRAMRAFMPRWRVKEYRRMVRRIEYIMQDKWGFDRDRSRHTHWERFEGFKN